MGHEWHRGRTGEVASVDFEGIESIWPTVWGEGPELPFDVEQVK